MWRVGWRDEAWGKLDGQWDLLIIGGGITGAGIAREAARRGWRALLVEQRDFAWGTSSRSSKLVHGGLRYLAAGEIGLTRDSVRERERLLAELPGLVTPLPFIIPAYAGKRLKRWVYQLGLTVYDGLAGQWRRHALDAGAVRLLAPHVRDEELTGGLQFADAQTDDARLVLRVLGEAVAAGATALNYVAAAGLIREEGRVAGALLRDAETGAEREVRARVVINATGAWVDGLRGQVGAPARMRPLRGSHLVFAAWRFPLAQAVSIAHPADGRPVFALPWEGATIVGTTDIDHDKPLDAEPAISGDEAAYLLAAVAATFPALKLGADDIVSTWSGVRPVVNTGRAPSEESRDHALWNEQGLLTVTGGKLTTFRLIARDALEACEADLPPAAADQPRARPEPALPAELPGDRRRRLLGRYGELAPELVAAA
ncbi:MAG TPA: glycerol-3-phosphate dehydrogenase/oxidase, partial [Herpetosiphonaceae bacterium]